MPDLERKSLAQWRKARNYTQMRLASEIGVTLATIGNLETGRNPPSYRVARLIADKLGILVDQIEWPEVRPYPSKANRKKEELVAA